MLIYGKDILCVANLQHNCAAHKSGLVAESFVCQERQLTSIEKWEVRHVDPSDLVLNMARMCDAVYMHPLRAKFCPEEVDLNAAIFEGVKSEIDGWKGGIIPQDNAVASQQIVGAHGRRVPQHVVGNRRSLAGRQQGRQGRNM